VSRYQPPRIITCGEWGARPPKQPPTPAGRPRLIVDHHTAGLAPHTGHGALADGIAYARAIQNDHMKPGHGGSPDGWNDSGHTFLVTRAGIILQGRWGSVTALEHGHMVVQAHCPGENDQPGIEHEGETGPMPPAQFRASVDLHVWICHLTGIRPTQFYPHKQFYPTACPGSLAADIPRLRLATADALTRLHALPAV
jgi:hypothetical protein